MKGVGYEFCRSPRTDRQTMEGILACALRLCRGVSCDRDCPPVRLALAGTIPHGIHFVLSGYRGDRNVGWVLARNCGNVTVDGLGQLFFPGTAKLIRGANA